MKDKRIIDEKEYNLQNTKLQDAHAKLAEVEEEIKEGTIVTSFDEILGIRKIRVESLLTLGTIITTIDDIKNKSRFSCTRKIFISNLYRLQKYNNKHCYSK